MVVPETITKLIERFDFHRQSHISSRDVYNETKLRQDYLDHVFIALGWDVYNTQEWLEQTHLNPTKSQANDSTSGIKQIIPEKRSM